MTTEQMEIEDLQAALKAGRKPRDHGPYKVKVGDHDLKFTDAVIDDPTPTGRQIIEGAGFRKAEACREALGQFDDCQSAAPPKLLLWLRQTFLKLSG